MDEHFRHWGRDVYVWTTPVAPGWFIWTFTIDDRLRDASEAEFCDDQSALDAGREAAIVYLDRADLGGSRAVH